MSYHVIYLPIELTNSNNGRTTHFGISASRRKKYGKIVPQPRQTFDHKMSVTVIRVLGERQRLWDSSSGLRGNYKEIEDSLVAAGWFHDDGPEWIEETRFRQDAGHRHVGPATIVVVHEISEEIDVDSIVDNVII